MFLLVLSAAAAFQLPQTVAPPTSCRDLAPVPTVAREPARPRKLTELPPGELFHTVLRSYGGCDIAEVRGIGPDGQAAWVWRPTGAFARPPLAPAR